MDTETQPPATTPTTTRNHVDTHLFCLRGFFFPVGRHRAKIQKTRRRPVLVVLALVDTQPGKKKRAANGIVKVFCEAQR